MSDEATVTDLPIKSMRDRILSHPRPKGETLEIPEWDVTVELSSMSIAQKGQLLGDEEPTPTKLMLMLPEVIVSTCYDPDSFNPIFTADDLDWLKSEPASIIERVATEGLRVSGIDEDAAAEKKDDS